MKKMEQKIFKKIIDILKNCCYCSEFNKPLDNPDTLISHLVIMFWATTKDNGKDKVEIARGFETPIVINSIDTKNKKKIKKIILKECKQFKKEFFKSVADGFCEQVSSTDLRLQEDLEDEPRQLSKEKIKSLKEYYEKKKKNEIRGWTRKGLKIIKQDKNYIHLCAPILDIRPIAPKVEGYKNIKELES